MIAAGLRQVAARGHAKFDAQMLKQNRHQIGDHDDRKKRVTELGATGQIGCPVARIHVADRDEKPRAGKCEQLPPKRSGRRDHDTAVDFRQRDLTGSSPPGHMRPCCNWALGLCHRFPGSVIFETSPTS